MRPIVSQSPKKIVNMIDHGPLSARNRTYGALIKELYRLSTSKDADDPSAVREFVLKKNILGKKTNATREKIWAQVRYRYMPDGSKHVWHALIYAAKDGIDSPDFVSLAYLYYALRDRTTREFIIGPLWEKWSGKSTTVGAGDILSYLEKASPGSPQIKKWSESTRKKLAGSILCALRDFGVLKGKQKKSIQHPAISLNTAYHLLYILKTEGKEGNDLIEAEEWKIFLWKKPEVVDALARMSQLKWVRFERSGKTVILELIRESGDHR